MEDYYKILGIQYNASITDISNSFNLKMIDYKCLPFLTDKDKQTIKNLKKAFFVLSNEEYKKTYDNSLKQQQVKPPNNNLKQVSQITGIESGNYFTWTSEISSQPVIIQIIIIQIIIIQIIIIQIIILIILIILIIKII